MVTTRTPQPERRPHSQPERPPHSQPERRPHSEPQPEHRPHSQPQPQSRPHPHPGQADVVGPRPAPVRDEASVRVWRFVREPFRADTWRRVAYALLALPVGVACVPLSLLGAPTGRWQRTLAHRFLGLREGIPQGIPQGIPEGIPEGGRPVSRPGSAGPPGPMEGLAHALLATPLNLLVLAVTGYGWSIVPMNLGWPLRAGSDYASAWGGPTFAGAWAFHALLGGLGFLLIMPWLGRAMAAVQLRLAAALLS
ncbi:hypothetical protein [Streptomyces sp. NPDC005281]|uniref:hypothetical protein n=1 Tax=Streptomyces sp. NPDC005281 TaxID=3155712 RepID=UPI0033BD3C74